jgi:hypothetical protein
MAVALAITVACLGGMLAAPVLGSAATISAVYRLSGTATVDPGACVGADCPPPESASGTASCSVCAPQGGVFSVRITTINTYPPGPCRVRSLSGVLSVTWSDGTTSTASVSGGLLDHTSLLVLLGTVDPASGGWATDRVLILLNNYPPGPCKAATTTVTGALIIVS